MNLLSRYNQRRRNFIEPADPTHPCKHCGHARNRHWRRISDALCSFGNGHWSHSESPACECPGYQPIEVAA